jgi:hypothetical protein
VDLAQIEQRAATLDSITTLATNDLAGYAQTILGESPPRVAAQIRDAVPAVVSSYGEVAAVSAADWYETVRPMAGFNAVPVTPPSLAQDTASTLGWALAPLFTETESDVLTRLTGGLIRLVAGFDRETVNVNSTRDPFAGRSKRVARPDACAFCAYMSVATENLHETTSKYHDHCRCYPVPFWETVGIPPLPQAAKWEEAASRARNAIEADYWEKRKLAPDLRRRNFYRKFPETAINTENIIARMRAELGTH